MKYANYYLQIINHNCCEIRIYRFFCAKNVQFLETQNMHLFYAKKKYAEIFFKQNFHFFVYIRNPVNLLKNIYI